MDLFTFDSYKNFVLSRISALPKKGYGQFRRLSTFMGVSTTYVSQVFQGEKSLNLEQATSVCEFFDLTDLETQYFLKLVLIERAGTAKLKKILLAEREKIKDQAQKISAHLKVSKVLSDEDRVVFYSDWFYSAIRLLSGIKGYQDIESISAYFGMPRSQVGNVVNFLLRAGLMTSSVQGLRVGPSRTHLEAESPFIKMHHLNWRYKAIENMTQVYPEKLHYSAPMTIGKKDVEKIRSMVVDFIASVGKVVDPSPNEELMCLSIDWFKIRPGQVVGE